VVGYLDGCETVGEFMIIGACMRSARSNAQHGMRLVIGWRENACSNQDAVANRALYWNKKWRVNANGRSSKLETTGFVD
jgi:hypothetical protein